MALKIGSKTISTNNFIDFNGRPIAQVFVTSPTQTSTFQGDLPGTNKPIQGGAYTPQFSFRGDLRSYQKSMSYSDTSGGLYSCTFLDVEYNSSIDTTIFTYKITGTNLHTVNYTYKATLYVWLDPIVVWQSTAKDLVVVVTGYRSPDGSNTDVGCEIHNISGVRIVGFKLTVTWDDGVSELYRYQVDHSSTSIAAGGSFIDESIQKYYDPSIVGILVSVRAFYSDGSQEIASDNISVSDLVESSQL